MSVNMLEKVLSYMTGGLRELFNLADAEILDKICEIRLKKDSPLRVVIRNGTYFLDYNADFYTSPPPHAVKVSEKELDELFMSFCGYTLHCHSQTLKAGFVSIDGGIRVGVAATAVYEGDKLSCVKDVSSLNIRIPREADGFSLPVLEKIYKNSVPGLIVAGPPSSGKTTFLRDLAKQLSGGFNNKYLRVCVVDERGEICPKSEGDFCINTGVNTDVLSFFPKAVGIENAVRTLSPELIVCDEIGNEEEERAIESALSSGVSFALSVHVRDRADLKRKSIIKSLIKTGEFSYIALLDNRSFKPEIIKISEEENEISRNGDFYRFNDGSGNFLFGKN